MKKSLDWEVGPTFHKILIHPLEMLAFLMYSSPGSVPAAGKFAVNLPCN